MKTPTILQLAAALFQLLVAVLIFLMSLPIVAAGFLARMWYVAMLFGWSSANEALDFISRPFPWEDGYKP